MYSELMSELNERYEKLKNFTGDYLRVYESQKRELNQSIGNLINQINLKKNISEAKLDNDSCFFTSVDKLFECEVKYFEKILEELEELKENAEELSTYKVNFISKKTESLKKSLENNEIDKLAKMIVIEEEGYSDGCILHYNADCENYANHKEFFYEYLCSTCETDCFQNEEEDVEEYKSCHYLHLNEDDIREYALTTIEEENE